MPAMAFAWFVGKDIALQGRSYGLGQGGLLC